MANCRIPTSSCLLQVARFLQTATSLIVTINRPLKPVSAWACSIGNLPNRILEPSIYKWGEGGLFPIFRFLFWPEDSTTVILARECPSPGTPFPFPPPPETNIFSPFKRKHTYILKQECDFTSFL